MNFTSWDREHDGNYCLHNDMMVESKKFNETLHNALLVEEKDMVRQIQDAKDIVKRLEDKQKEIIKKKCQNGFHFMNGMEYADGNCIYCGLAW